MPRRPKPYKYRGWYVTDAGGVPHHKLCPIEEGMAEAEKKLRKHLTAMDEAREESPTPGPGVRPAAFAPEASPHGKLVCDAHDDFLDAKKVESEELTYVHYVDKLAPFYDRFGTRAVASITEADGIAYKRYLMKEKEWTKGKTPMKGLGACSVNHHLRAARTFLNWCCKEGRRYLQRNPWEDVKYLKEQGRERVVTPEEFATLLKHCVTCRYATKDKHDKAACSFCRAADNFRQILTVLRHTTMRPGELRQLEWDEVDFDRHRLNMSASKIKTRSRRVITLLPEVEAVLLARRDAAGGDSASGLVFPGRDGEELDRVSFSQRFRRLRTRAVKAKDLAEEKKGEKLVLYSTRHTRITELFVEGNEQHVVMAESGHVVPATTERYKHLADDYVTGRVRQNSRKRDGGGGSAGG
jgi:integrase